MTEAAGETVAPKQPPRPGVPMACRWLGGLGALPFVGLAVGSFWLDGLPQAYTVFALTAYGAVILSFLGGIQWGLAVADYGAAQGRGASYRRLTISVVPSLIAWWALLLTGPTALLVLACSFALMLALDWTATRSGEAPDWYPRLRLPLTACVVACLALGAAA